MKKPTSPKKEDLLIFKERAKESTVSYNDLLKKLVNKRKNSHRKLHAKTAN